MSVLVEAICVLVPRHVLDVSYPGGTDAFLAEATEREDVRYAIADDRLACVSVCTQEAMLATVEPLLEHGIVWGDDDHRAVEINCVDQEQGLFLDCDWLEFERHVHGFTRAWTGADGDAALVAPPGWRLQRAWDLERSDIREGNDDMLRLAEENGLETWLDTSTGKMTVGRSEHPVVIPVAGGLTDRPAVPELGRSLAAVRLLLGLREIPYRVDVGLGAVTIPFQSPDGMRVQLIVREQDDGNVRFDAVLPFRVPEEHAAGVVALGSAVDALADTREAGVAVAFDRCTRTVAMATVVAPFVGAQSMRRLESTIGLASDVADDLVEALATVRSGGEPSEAAARLVRGVQERRAASAGALASGAEAEA